MKLLNLVWIIPLYGYLIYKIIQTGYVIFKNIPQIYGSTGIIMALLPSFYFWISFYIISIIAPIYAMCMIWELTLTLNEVKIKDKVKYILCIIIGLFVLNLIISVIEPYSYPLFVDSQGFERVRLFPFIPPVKH